MKIRPMKSRFAKPCREIPTELDSYEIRKAATYMGEKPSGDCHIELFFGFFFDGTRNNMYTSEESDDDTETNVARLWHVFNDNIEPSYSPRQHRFRSYIEGVGTPCMKKIGDPGIGAHAGTGAAAAWGGEGRINWALLKFQDHLYSHFMGSRVFTDDIDQDTISLVKQMSSDMAMSRFQIRQLATAARMSVEQYGKIKPGSPDVVALREELDACSNLSGVGAEQVAASNDEQRIAVLQHRNKTLAKSLKGFLNNYPKIAKIRLSIFGFSRGSAEARVFANWLVDACDPPEPTVPAKASDPRGNANGLRLCGIPVEIDFMGLFDTVASVGAAQSFLPTAFSGHGGWGRQQDMAIPAYVRRCVHMVAAHEVRGSFPLDLIEGDGHEEIVYPGVHSDVGGGYRPGEQGRIGGGDSKLSQIALCDMYREAVAAGVPLRLDKFPTMREKFAVSTSLRQTFNAYVNATADISQRATGTQELMHGHYGLYLRWRHLRAMRGPDWIGDTPSAQRARRSYPQEIRAIWNTPQPLAPAVIDLYDNYTHDSRAWFKPVGDDDDVWFSKQRRRMEDLASRVWVNEHAAGYVPAHAQHPKLNDQEKEELARWQANPDDLPLQASGREYYWMWGYLRWRTLYANSLAQALSLREQAAAEQARLRRDNVGALEVLEELPGLVI